MNKYISAMFNIMLIFSLFLACFFGTPKVSAQTLGDLEKHLDDLQAKDNENNNQIKQNQAQITDTQNNVTKINNDIANISQEIIRKNKEIDDLNVKIAQKDEETKKLMQYLQKSDGDSFYLEYIMGSVSMTDFIYRLSVTEQLSKYNTDLIEQMNSMIKTNNARKVELANKQVELADKQVELGKNLQFLASQRVQLDEFSRSIADEIAASREVIKNYQAAGCKLNDDLNVCANHVLPADTQFWRPVTQGYITQNFHTGHYALDIGNHSDQSTKIYSIAAGIVEKVIYDEDRNSGGYQVVVHHKIISNGVAKNYTSTYCHLSKILVKEKQIVSRDTVIGYMGNTGHVDPLPTPSNPTAGTHVHFALSTGLRYVDYYTYDAYIAHSFDPRTMINFPSGTYNEWSNRTYKY